MIPALIPKTHATQTLANRVADADKINDYMGIPGVAPPAGLEPAHPIPETGSRFRPPSLTKPQVRDLHALSKAISIRLRIWAY